MLGFILFIFFPQCSCSKKRKGIWTAPRVAINPARVSSIERRGQRRGVRGLAGAAIAISVRLVSEGPQPPCRRTRDPGRGVATGGVAPSEPRPPGSWARGAFRACAGTSPRSSHDGGCSPRRRARDARWGRRRRARGPRGSVALMSPFVSPLRHPSPHLSPPGNAGARPPPHRKAWTTAPTSSPRRTAE